MHLDIGMDEREEPALITALDGAEDIITLMFSLIRMTRSFFLSCPALTVAVPNARDRHYDCLPGPPVHMAER